MKKTYILLLLSFSLSTVIAQVSISFPNNGLITGDSAQSNEINYIDPGNAGENLVWDFSGIQYTGKTTYCGVGEDMTKNGAGLNGKGIILTEDGYVYNYITRENGCEETGYVNTGKKMTMEYSDPVVKMIYPFCYGQQFSDTFAGVALFSGTSRIDVNGTYTVAADAFGTLILPDRILKNTLRVKAVRQSLQISVCGSNQANSVKYYWYVPGYRYPVVMLGTAENRYGGQEPVVVQNAWVNLHQSNAGAGSQVADQKDQGEANENAVIVFPNPFTEQLTYNYFLRSQVPVSVELYDMSGKFNIRIEKKQTQSEGLHTGTIRASTHGLPPGVYYLRFTFDKQVVINKVVKV